MNKILYLKILVGFITFLIFLTLTGIVYGIVNYKTTPKLLSGKRKAAKAAAMSAPAQTPRAINLDRADKTIAHIAACGDYVCLTLAGKKGNVREAVIISPDSAQPPVFISVNPAP